MLPSSLSQAATPRRSDRLIGALAAKQHVVTRGQDGFARTWDRHDPGHKINVDGAKNKIMSCLSDWSWASASTHTASVTGSVGSEGPPLLLGLIFNLHHPATTSARSASWFIGNHPQSPPRPCCHPGPVWPSASETAPSYYNNYRIGDDCTIKADATGRCRRETRPDWTRRKARISGTRAYHSSTALLRSRKSA